MVSEFPGDEHTFGLGDQFMLGKGLLIKPVVRKDQSSVDVYLPPASVSSVFDGFLVEGFELNVFLACVIIDMVRLCVARKSVPIEFRNTYREDSYS